MVSDAKLAQIRPLAIYSEGSGSYERRNEFAGRYIGDGYLITFPLILYGGKKKKKTDREKDWITRRARARQI